MSAYIPQPGTSPARVIAWLQAQPAGAKFTASVLGEELGIDRNTISPILAWPVKKGALRVEKINGLLYWSLPIPGGMASAPSAPPADDDEHDDAPPVQRTVPAASAPKLEIPPPAPAVVPSLPPSLRPGHPKPARKTPPRSRVPVPAKPKPVDIHLVAAEPSRHDTRLAVWSDGALTIERGAARMDFTVDETRRILAYLDRLREVEA